MAEDQTPNDSSSPLKASQLSQTDQLSLPTRESSAVISQQTESQQADEICSLSASEPTIETSHVSLDSSHPPFEILIRDTADAVITTAAQAQTAPDSTDCKIHSSTSQSLPATTHVPETEVASYALYSTSSYPPAASAAALPLLPSNEQQVLNNLVIQK